MSYLKIAHMAILGLVALASPFTNVTDYADKHQVLSAVLSGLVALAALFTNPDAQKTVPDPKADA